MISWCFIGERGGFSDWFIINAMSRLASGGEETLGVGPARDYRYFIGVFVSKHFELATRHEAYRSTIFSSSTMNAK